MKRFFLLLITLFTMGSSLAQDADGPIVPLSERVFLTTERSVFALGDVVNVRGTVLSTDYNDFLPYSRYVNLELIGSVTDKKGREHQDSVIVRQKVRCDERGYFFATVPTADCRQEGRYYLRAYTRFMRNQPVETFAMTSVLLTYDARKEGNSGGACVVSLYPEGGTLMAGVQQQLVAFVTDAFGNPLGGAQLAVIADADTLAAATTRPSGYAALTLMDNALAASAQAYVGVVNGAHQMRTELPAIAPAAPFLRFCRTGKKLRIQLAGKALANPATSHLYAFQNGFGLKEIALPTEGRVTVIDTSEMPEGLCTFWLTDDTPASADKSAAAPQILDQRSIWIGQVPTSKVADKALADGEGIVIRHIVSSEHPSPRAFQMLQLYNVRSEAPFPTALYSEEEREARVDLDLWLATTRFVGFDLADALAARFAYPFAPEKAMVISGKALMPDGRALKAGSVEILNLETMDNHICPITEGGHYEQAVADYVDGERFFIESIDARNKNHRYGVTLEEERPATMHNWLRISDEASAHTGHLAHTVISSLAGGVDLNEAVVTARSNHRPDLHASQLEGVYIFSHATLQQPQYYDLESVLRRSGWVDIKLADTDNPAPEYVKNLRGANVRMTMDNDWDSKEPINKVCIYRSERVGKQSLQEGGVRWMNFLLDDVLYTHNFEDILSMPVDGLESIEIVKPTLSDPRLIRNHSMDGLVIIKSRHVMKSKDIPSAGITVQPAGLTPSPSFGGAMGGCPDAPAALRPARGERIAVEFITPDRQIFSWEE